jgi:hypothetical protein
MAINQVRKSLILDESLYEEVIEFRHGAKINTEVDAFRTLIMAGIHFMRLKQDEQFEMDEQAAVERLNNAMR